MKKEPMRTRVPFTRRLAVILAVTMFQTSIAGAVSPAPSKLAVLEPPMPVPEMRAAWDGIRSEVYLDPLLLVRGREEVLKTLQEWRQAGQAVRSAYKTADRITLDRTQALIEEAWAFYYQFNYDSAIEVLSQAEELLSTPGDSGFRTHLMFEVLLLSGIVARAACDKYSTTDKPRFAPTVIHHPNSYKLYCMGYDSNARPSTPPPQPEILIWDEESLVKHNRLNPHLELSVVPNE